MGVPTLLSQQHNSISSAGKMIRSQPFTRSPIRYNGPGLTARQFRQQMAQAYLYSVKNLMNGMNGIEAGPLGKASSKWFDTVGVWADPFARRFGERLGEGHSLEKTSRGKFCEKAAFRISASDSGLSSIDDALAMIFFFFYISDYYWSMRRLFSSTSKTKALRFW